MRGQLRFGMLSFAEGHVQGEVRCTQRERRSKLLSWMGLARLPAMIQG